MNLNNIVINSFCCPGKGVVADESQYCVSTARTQALLKADVILLLGARLNWMLHFGQQPRFAPDVKVIQVMPELYCQHFNRDYFNNIEFGKQKKKDRIFQCLNHINLVFPKFQVSFLTDRMQLTKELVSNTELLL